MHIVISIVLAILLTACGGGGDDNSSVDGRVAPPPGPCAVDRTPCL